MSSDEQPQFMAIDSKNEAYQRTIEEAQARLEDFKSALDNLPEDIYACVKFFLPENPEANEGANIWFMNPFFEHGFCFACAFELPPEFEWNTDWFKFREEDLMDWYLLTESGDLTGGFSLRYQRELTPDHKKNEFDERIGVRKYL